MGHERYGLPPQLFTATPNSRSSQSRVAVDVGGTGFFEGRNFRISYEFSVPSASSIWLKVSSPIDFILKLQSITIDAGAVRFRAYRDGTDNGGWSAIDVFKMNFTQEAEDQGYVRQTTIEDGGTLTPGANTPSETVMVRTSGATAQRTTVSANIGGERGIAAGSYYLRFESVGDGENAASGVYDLIFEERPADLNQWLVEL